KELWQNDANYMEVARLLMKNHAIVQRIGIASHDPRTIVSAALWAKKLDVNPDHLEFQTLFGMTENMKRALMELLRIVWGNESPQPRVYAYTPLVLRGEIEKGVQYHFRRFQENSTANSVDENVSRAEIGKIDVGRLTAPRWKVQSVEAGIRRESELLFQNRPYEKINIRTEYGDHSLNSLDMDLWLYETQNMDQRIAMALALGRMNYQKSLMSKLAVMPAKAGTQGRLHRWSWIPAFAGMTAHRLFGQRVEIIENVSGPTFSEKIQDIESLLSDGKASNGELEESLYKSDEIRPISFQEAVRLIQTFLAIASIARERNSALAQYIVRRALERVRDLALKENHYFIRDPHFLFLVQELSRWKPDYLWEAANRDLKNLKYQTYAILAREFKIAGKEPEGERALNLALESEKSAQDGSACLFVAERLAEVGAHSEYGLARTTLKNVTEPAARAKAFMSLASYAFEKNLDGAPIEIWLKDAEEAIRKTNDSSGLLYGYHYTQSELLDRLAATLVKILGRSGNVLLWAETIADARNPEFIEKMGNLLLYEAALRVSEKEYRRGRKIRTPAGSTIRYYDAHLLILLPFLIVNFRKEIALQAWQFLLWTMVHPLESAAGVVIFTAFAVWVARHFENKENRVAKRLQSFSSGEWYSQFKEFVENGDDMEARGSLKSRLKENVSRNEREIIAGALLALGEEASDVQLILDHDRRANILSALENLAPKPGSFLQRYVSQHIGFRHLQGNRKNSWRKKEGVRLGYSLVEMLTLPINKRLGKKEEIFRLDGRTLVLIAGESDEYMPDILGSILSAMAEGAYDGKLVLASSSQGNLNALIGQLTAKEKNELERLKNQKKPRLTVWIDEVTTEDRTKKVKKVDTGKIYDRLLRIRWNSRFAVYSENPQRDIWESAIHSIWATIYKIISPTEAEKVMGLNDLMHKREKDAVDSAA
ncbi:MAG: proline dehydrogenase family protein, partial [Elusimicrobia bacterium]|nr:proline dehydrogenase family protein [Elusimicrobiota bacterium]